MIAATGHARRRITLDADLLTSEAARRGLPVETVHEAGADLWVVTVGELEFVAAAEVGAA